MLIPWRIIALAAVAISGVVYPVTSAADAPQPLTEAGKGVDWWFVFKFNTKSFPGCSAGAQPVCRFGGDLSAKKSSQQYVFATKEAPALKEGKGCVGDTVTDPVGATFDQLYNGTYYYVVWNDQFYDDPSIAGCKKSCSGPWGHSKGVLAWDDSGQGLAIQVTTPSWPAAGSKGSPRATDGNTLACIASTNNLLVSQSFFALRLSRADVVIMLKALANASAVTDPSNPQIVRNGGPEEIQAQVGELGKRSKTREILQERLSTGVTLLAKPSALHVPPWQFVSARLEQAPLRVATWWTYPAIDSTKSTTPIGCWDDKLPKPGPVEVATSGSWKGTGFGLKGGPGPDFNHAKIGVSTGDRPYVIFGDMNQQGALTDADCGRSQNGRGGLFFIVEDATLSKSVADLIRGASAPLAGSN